MRRVYQFENQLRALDLSAIGRIEVSSYCGSCVMRLSFPLTVLAESSRAIVSAIIAVRVR